jgi:hypothetical protein
VNNLNVPPSRLSVGMTISMPLKENIEIDDVYKSVVLYIEGAKLRVNLMPLKLYDFDLILGMDWLSRHKAQVDCFTKIMVIQVEGEKRVVFRGERTVVLNYIISDMMAEKLIRKRCPI